MSEAPKTTIHAARVTIEFTTPFHVGSGEREDASDAGVVTDATGLPSLPASSLQGVLRSACLSQGMDEDIVYSIFGRGVREADKEKPEHAARLRFSWGRIHGADDKPVGRWANPGDDRVLKNALQPTLRDHVRMTHRKVADTKDQGKFDELAVCAGHRFTFDLICQDPGGQLGGAWAGLLDVLAKPTTRFGGKTRRGFGAFKVVRIWKEDFNLGEDAGRTEWLKHLDGHGAALAKDPGQVKVENHPSQGAGFIKLKPETPWMIGGGSDPDADSAPVRDQRIAWESGGGTVQECFVIPGSSVKGALAHRTCFHANRLKGVFAEQLGDRKPEDVTGENNATIKDLFGAIADDNDGMQQGAPGKVFIDDVYIPIEDSENPKYLLPPQNHVAIDPFTGGAKDTALFQDRPLHGTGGVSIPIAVCQGINGKRAEALLAALDDLCEGRLALGAHAGRGYGYFTGSHNLKLSPATS